MAVSIPGVRVNDLRASLPVHPKKRYNRRRLEDIRSAAIHHSLTSTGTPKAFAVYHIRENGWPGIGYHFVIDKAGVIYWCNNLETISFHVGNSNKHAVGICLIGDFRKENPPSKQLQATYKLLVSLQGVLPNMHQVFGHQEYAGYGWKRCPAFDMNKFRTDFAQFVRKQQESGKKELKLPVAIEVNGKRLAVTGYLENDTSWLPVRAVATAAGGKVGWDSRNRQVRVNELNLNEVLVSGSAFAPARELGAALGLQVGWDGKSRTVKLTGAG
jgi:N-acetylmuramoyl-L-alanine amidase